MKTTYFNFDIPTQPNDHKILGNVLASADALAVSEIAEQYDGLTVVVTPDMLTKNEHYDGLKRNFFNF